MLLYSESGKEKAFHNSNYKNIFPYSFMNCFLVFAVDSCLLAILVVNACLNLNHCLIFNIEIEEIKIIVQKMNLIPLSPI